MKLNGSLGRRSSGKAAAAVSPLQCALSDCRRALLWLALFSLAINLLVLASPIYMMQVFDRVLSGGRTETLLFLTILAGAAVLVMGLLETVRNRFSQRIGSWLERRLGPDLIEGILSTRLAGRPATAQPLRDLATVRMTLSSPLPNALIDTPWVPLFVLVIWILHPWLGVIALAAATILATIALANELVSRRLLRQAGSLSIAATQSAEAGLRNAEAVHAMGMTPALIARYAAANDEALALQRQANDRNAALIGLSKFLRLFAQILILGAGALLVLRSELTAGSMIAGSILLSRALAPVEQSVGAWKQLVAARDSWLRLGRLFASAPMRPLGMPLPAPVGRLSCEGVSYVAPTREEPILKGISFALDAGAALGIIGPSAAGKSTLCKILVGNWKPTHGHARLDGADICAWHADHLGPHVGYLPQDVELFAGTVEDNIARLNPDPDPAMVIEAARIAGVHEMILRLPRGYDTQVGEAGVLLSGGQRQRIGLARALYGRPKLIALDEPGASLDARGEQALVEAILVIKRWGSTVILVTHQPSILRAVDKLMVIREGTLDAFGPRDEVHGKLRLARAATPRKALEKQEEARPGRESTG